MGALLLLFGSQKPVAPAQKPALLGDVPVAAARVLPTKSVDELLLQRQRPGVLAAERFAAASAATPAALVASRRFIAVLAL